MEKIITTIIYNIYLTKQLFDWSQSLIQEPLFHDLHMNSQPNKKKLYLDFHPQVC